MSSVLEERITQGHRLVRATYDPDADAVALHFQSEPEPSGLGESAIAYSEYWEPPDFQGLVSPLYLHFDGDDRQTFTTPASCCPKSSSRKRR